MMNEADYKLRGLEIAKLARKVGISRARYKKLKAEYARLLEDSRNYLHARRALEGLTAQVNRQASALVELHRTINQLQMENAILKSFLSESSKEMFKHE